MENENCTLTEVVQRIARLEASHDAKTELEASRERLLTEKAARLQDKIDFTKDLLAQAQLTAQRANDKYEEAQMQRNMQQNEWRGSLDDATKKQVSTDTHLSDIRRLDESHKGDVQRLTEINKEMSKRVEKIEDDNRTREGRTAGVKMTSGAIISGLGVIVLLITIATTFVAVIVFVTRSH